MKTVTRITPSPQLDPSRRFLSVAEASLYDGMSIAWHSKMRLEGGGIPYVKVGRSIRYDIHDIDAYFAERAVRYGVAPR